jgi:uncharacterized protein (DUF433 family)
MMVRAARAAEIAGVSRQRLYYWEKTHLVDPTVRRVVSPRNIVRLYSLDALVELVVTARLTEWPHVSTHYVRAVLGYLRSQGYAHPARELRFAVSGKQIFFQHDDGSWEGSRQPSQTVAVMLLDLVEIRARIFRQLERQPEDVGRIARVRRVRSSRPVFSGTRIPVSAVAEYLAEDRSDADILAAFPELAADDIAEARRTQTLAG